MKIYKTQSQVEKDIKDGVLAIEGDVIFECSILIYASILVSSGNIDALDIDAEDINALNIKAGNINALNIKALDINALDINAWDIDAEDIKARNINAWDITYYAFCSVYRSITCTSIKARKYVHQKPVCLDGELTIKSRA